MLSDKVYIRTVPKLIIINMTIFKIKTEIIDLSNYDKEVFK